MDDNNKMEDFLSNTVMNLGGFDTDYDFEKYLSDLKDDINTTLNFGEDFVDLILKNQQPVNIFFESEYQEKHDNGEEMRDFSIIDFLQINDHNDFGIFNRGDFEDLLKNILQNKNRKVKTIQRRKFGLYVNIPKHIHSYWDTPEEDQDEQNPPDPLIFIYVKTIEDFVLNNYHEFDNPFNQSKNKILYFVITKVLLHELTHHAFSIPKEFHPFSDYDPILKFYKRMISESLANFGAYHLLSMNYSDIIPRQLICLMNKNLAPYLGIEFWNRLLEDDLLLILDFITEQNRIKEYQQRMNEIESMSKILSDKVRIPKSWPISNISYHIHDLLAIRANIFVPEIYIKEIGKRILINAAEFALDCQKTKKKFIPCFFRIQGFITRGTNASDLCT